MAFDLDALNEIQKKIVLDVDGAILVTAGAGSGKTRLLTHRICNLIKNHNINSENILAITFTNKATNEMKDRIASMIGNNHCWISTFHSMCAKILRQNIDNIDGFDKNFTIYDEGDKDKILKNILKSKEIDDNELKNKISWHISNAKNLGLEPSEYKLENKWQQDIDNICDFYLLYELELKRNNALDFDDLMLKTLELFKNNDVLEYYQNKFQYIHVDEFQDTNLVQYKLLKLLSAKYKNIFVVGDEDQCIYCWRGANIENINSFIKDFNCKIYKLEQNYRSTKNIIEVANKLIKNNTSRIEKTLFTENEDGDIVIFSSNSDENAECEYVVRTIKTLIGQGVNYKDICVLMRISALSRLFEEKLLNYNVPYKVSGIMKFFERLEIKNILAYLSVINNTHDGQSLVRIINFPKRSIGATTVEKLQSLAIIENKSIYDYITQSNLEEFNRGTRDKINDFANLLLRLQEKNKEMGLYEFVKYVVNESGINGLYNTKDEEDINRKLNIDSLLNSVKNFEDANDGCTLTDYLESVTLQNELDENEDENNAVTISTIHASKGLEFDYIFVVGAEEGRLPLSRAYDENDMEEERRLMYVAITRARKKLFITNAKSRFLYGKRDYTENSRFIKEMNLKTINDINGANFSSFGNNYNRYYQEESSINNYNNYSKMGGINRNKYSNSSDDIILKDEKVSTNLQDFYKAKLNKQQNDFDNYQVGTNVLHTKFGIGKITNVEGTLNNKYVTVDFGGFGVKKLSLSMVSLQILK